jgi:excisionase family DNA binding protein
MQEVSENRNKPELSTTAVARAIGVSVPTVRAMAERGEIAGWRIGSRYKFARVAVEEFLTKSARPLTA